MKATVNMHRSPCLETEIPEIWRCAVILTITRIHSQRRLCFVDPGFFASMIPASLQSFPEQPSLQVFTSLFFPTLLSVRVYNSLHIHIYPSIVQYTLEHHSFSQVSAFRFFRYSSFLSFYTLLNTNAFLHKTLSSIPHSCPRRRPASTSCERLVRSVHPRQMLLGHPCRDWLFWVGEHCQSVFYFCQAPRFSVPFADIICLCIQSGGLSVRFRTLPLPLVGRL